MYWILNYVTGIPPLEAQMLRSRGDAYRAYRRTPRDFFHCRQLPDRYTSLSMRRWRWFLLATAGLFGHASGNEWGVSHYLLKAS